MNSCSSHARTHREVERLFTRGLPRRRHERLRGHLRDCDSCRAHYEAVHSAEDALFDSPDGLNPAALGRLGDLVLATPEPLPFWRRSPAWTASLAVTGLALLAILLVQIPSPRDSDSEFVARGVHAMPAAGGLTLFKVDPASESVERLSRLPAGTPVKSGSVVQMAYTNTDFTYALVLGLDANLELQWYHPADVGDGPAGAPLRAGGVDTPFGTAWKLEAPRGPLRLFIVFAREPIDPAAVTVAVDALRRDGVSPRDVERLPGIGLHQDSVLLELR